MSQSRWFTLSTLLVAASICSQADSQKLRERVTVSTCYDSLYFYVAAAVRKPSLNGRLNIVFGNPRADDSVGVYLDADPDPNRVRRSDRSISMIVSVAGGMQLYRGPEAKPLSGYADLAVGPDGKAIPFKAGVTRQGDLNGSAAVTNTYFVEMAIPWVELGGMPKSGTSMRFNIASFSAAPDSPAVLSLSPKVKAEADVENPSTWAEVVFVDAPVKTSASHPDARVSSKVAGSAPTIDGEIESANWPAITSFGYAETESGSGEVTANVLSGRTHVTVPLKPAPPTMAQPLKPIFPRASSLIKKWNNIAPHMMALYRFDYQNDARRSAPLVPFQGKGIGLSTYPTPFDGLGPWMSYDRVDWHARHLIDMSAAGVDTVLPIYRSSIKDKQRQSVRGLMTLVAALKSLEEQGANHPQVGLYLDTNSIPTNDAVGNLWTAISEFYGLIPDRFRLKISAELGTELPGVPVFLNDGRPFSTLGSAIIDGVRQAAMEQLGVDLIFVCDTSFAKKCEPDAFASLQSDDAVPSSSLRVAVVRPADKSTGVDFTMLRRRDGQAFRDGVRKAFLGKPNWIVLQSWNDYDSGLVVAPTIQDGLEGIDGIRLAARQLTAGKAPLTQSIDLPRIWRPATTYFVHAEVGTDIASATVPSFLFQWLKSDGTKLGLPVPAPSQNGGRTVIAPLKAPDNPGAFGLRLIRVIPGSQTEEIIGQWAAKVATNGAEATIIKSTLPTIVEAGGAYPITLIVRNDSSTTWKAGSARIRQRLLRRTSPINAAGESGGLSEVAIADSSTSPEKDIAPGETATVRLTVVLTDPTGTAIPAWNATDGWIYETLIEVTESANRVALSNVEAICLVDSDVGALFVNERTPTQLPAEKRIPVRMGLKNTGAQGWQKNVTKIGYHWYSVDGKELVWDDELTPLTVDVPPGGEVKDLLAWVTAPPIDGPCYLEWDVKIGDTWVSTLPSTRSGESVVRRIDVIQGRCRLIDLTRYFNIDVISSSGTRSGAFDETGRSLPSELMPPWAFQPVVFSATPKGAPIPYISFRTGGNGLKENNAIRCVGQKIALAEPRKGTNAARLHILAASTRDTDVVPFTILYDDNSEQLVNISINAWNKPTDVTSIVLALPYVRSASGGEEMTPAAIYRYTMKVADSTHKPVAIILPNHPEIRILAMTLER